MTRKDYILIARALSTMSVPDEAKRAAVAVGKALEIDNPRFDKDKFIRRVAIERYYRLQADARAARAGK